MRYAQVCLDIKLAAIGNVLTYAIPEALDGKVQVGSCVAVPLSDKAIAKQDGLVGRVLAFRQ